MRHPFSDTEYEATDDGNVRVRDLATGDEGVFDRDGTWLAGTVRWADPHMARWVADKGRSRRLASMRSSTPYRRADREDKGAGS